MKDPADLKDKQAFSSRRYDPSFEKLRTEKYNFLKEFSSKYGYNGKVDQIRDKEYPQLKNSVYLDHTGTTTFAKSAIKKFSHDILTNLYGNPHSNSPSSQASSKRIEDVRKRILNHFNADEQDYSVIFTQNATGAAKLVGEMIPWTNKSTYRYLRESHNSINGLRRFLEKINPQNIYGMSEKDVQLLLSNTQPPAYLSDNDNKDNKDKVTYSLFAYPAQCNFSGMKFPLNWVSEIKKLNTKDSKTLVLLDAAAYVPTSPLSLIDKDNSPDFVIFSFYKMFGFPTGLGALIVKNELEPILQKGYFGGGTTDSVVYDVPWQKFSKNLSTRYEDGTVNFLNIIALDHAFDSFEKMYKSNDNISKHVSSLITFLNRNMRAFRHWNGKKVCFINSDRDFSDSKQQGGVFSFNVKRSDGSYVGYLEIEKLASANDIHIRSGSNCNPGSISRWCGISAEEVIQSYDDGKHCGDEKDSYKGKCYGAVRLSIGAMTTIEDILIWLDFFKKHYVEVMPGVTTNDMTYNVNEKRNSGIISDDDHNSDYDFPNNQQQYSLLYTFRNFFICC